MARARNIKPGFFQNETLGDIDPLARLFFIGLWTIADYKGCLEFRKKRIKVQLLPYDECDIGQLAITLERSGFISIYSVAGQEYLKIHNFERHQNPHKNERESGSDIPEMPVNTEAKEDSRLIAINLEQNGTARASSLFPLPSSLNPDSLAPDAKPPEPHASASSEFTIHLGEIITGVKKEFGLKKLSDAESRDWSNHAFLAFENEFTATDFLESLTLLRKQKWRNGLVSPDTVRKNLSNLSKLRDDVSNQNNGKPRTEREKSSDRSDNAIAIIDELRRQGHAEEQALSRGNNGDRSPNDIVVESAELN